MHLYRIATTVILVFLCALNAAGSTNPSVASSYLDENALIGFDFYLDGFNEGATVTGNFFGVDANGDGRLSYVGSRNEITDISLHFSGNSLVPAFTLVSVQDITPRFSPDGRRLPSATNGLVAFGYNFKDGPILGDQDGGLDVGEVLSIDNFSSATPAPHFSFDTVFGADPGSTILYFGLDDTGESVFESITSTEHIVTTPIASVPEATSVVTWMTLVCFASFFSLWSLRRAKPGRSS